MYIVKMSRQTFNENYHFQEVAANKERCCRNCGNFRRHPSAVTFCHHLFYVLEKQADARVWGKSGCDCFNILLAGGEN